MRQTKAELRKEFDRVEHENYLVQQENVGIADELQTLKNTIEVHRIRIEYLRTREDDLCRMMNDQNTSLANMYEENESLQEKVTRMSRDGNILISLVIKLQGELDGTAK